MVDMLQVTPEERPLLNKARVKLDNGERLTREETILVFKDDARAFIDEMNRITRESRSATGADKIFSYTRGERRAIECVISFLYGRMMKVSDIGQQKHEKLEDRVAALERLGAERIRKLEQGVARNSAKLTQSRLTLGDRITALEAAAKPRQRTTASRRRA